MFYTYILLRMYNRRRARPADHRSCLIGLWRWLDLLTSRRIRSFQPDVFVSNICVIAGGVLLPRELQGKRRKENEGNYRLNMKNWISSCLIQVGHLHTSLNVGRFVMQRPSVTLGWAGGDDATMSHIFSFSPPRLRLMTKRWVTAPS